MSAEAHRCLRAHGEPSAAPRPPTPGTGTAPPAPRPALQAWGPPLLALGPSLRVRGPPLRAHGPPLGRGDRPSGLGDRPSSVGTAPPATRTAPPGSRTAPSPEAPPCSPPIGPARPSPRPGTAQPRPPRYCSGHLVSPGIVASGKRAQSPAGLGSAFPPVSPKVTEAFVPRKPPPGRPASPLLWCLVGMLWVVPVFLLPAVSGRSLQSGRAGGDRSGSRGRPTAAEGGRRFAFCLS